MLGHRLVAADRRRESTAPCLFGSGTNENVFLLDHQIDGVARFASFLFAAERSEALLQSLPGQHIDVRHPLRGVDAGQGDDRIAEGEYGGDAGLEFPVGTAS